MNALVYSLPYLLTYLGASLVIVKRHSPRWLAVLMGVALLIPGPQDELVVLLIVAAMVMVKPALRAELRSVWSIR